MRPEFPECSWEASFRCQGMKWMKNHFLMQGLYPVGIAGSYSAGRVVQAPFGGNRTHDPSYYIMKMELAKGKRKRDGPVRVLCRPHRSNVSQGRNKKRAANLRWRLSFIKWSIVHGSRTRKVHSRYCGKFQAPRNTRWTSTVFISSLTR